MAGAALGIRAARVGPSPSAVDADRPTAPILRQGVNCWRRTRARRVAFLIDGEAYFAAFAAAAARARHCIFIVGWDIHSRTPLPSVDATLRLFLDRLAARQRGLRIYVLDWDFSLLYALEREPLPLLQFGWRSHARVRFAFDRTQPVEASHHQKLVVIDDAIAFAGGLDLTVRRWDTPAHRADEPLRRCPGGAAYGPFHDVQMAVDGDGAAALGVLARQRWQAATGESVPPVCSAAECWPDDLVPDLTDATVGIARTGAAAGGGVAVREVEQLYLDAIAGARRSIYLESQYLTAARIGAALAARLREVSGPEIVIVTGKTCSGWLEERTMGSLRAAWLQRLQAADRFGRLRVYAPIVAGPVPVTVHAKVLVVDDVLARVGSANLSNRSMGLDSECDLAVEADATPRARAAVAGLRDRLLAEHLGCDAARIAALLRREGSLVRAVEALRGAARTLEPLAVDRAIPDDPLFLTALADPEQPIAADEWARLLVPDEIQEAPRWPSRRLVAVLALLTVIAIAWWWLAPVWFEPAQLARQAARLAAQPQAPLWMVGAYVVAGLLAAPVSPLVVATVWAFGGVRGSAYALVGALVSAVILFVAGRLLGHARLRQVLGARLPRLRHRLADCGVLAFALLRMLPIAPFSVVNLLAGATGMSLSCYLTGTALGMAPGIAALAVATEGLASAKTSVAIGALLAMGLLGTLAIAGRRLARRPRAVSRPGRASPGD